ncbi:MAG TPA: HAD family hydrolase [Gaiellaceae bacterium]|nr:HAD family hydrolase [Gaiellaceae bacterium]
MGAHDVVFLVDVDNTLLDNDAVRDDVRAAFVAAYGEERAGRYWTIQERRFVELEYRDYLGAVQEWWEEERRDSRLVGAARILLDYPFAERVYPGALEVLAHLRTLGPTAVVTDGEAVFQPHKVARSGIWKAVAGNVLVYVHKELSLDDVERRYPAGRYVFVDDKLRILTAVKAFWGARVTTVLPLQGQFATDPEVAASHPAADVTIDGIAELIRLEL